MRNSGYVAPSPKTETTDPVMVLQGLFFVVGFTPCHETWSAAHKDTFKCFQVPAKTGSNPTNKGRQYEIVMKKEQSTE